MNVHLVLTMFRYFLMENRTRHISFIVCLFYLMTPMAEMFFVSNFMHKQIFFQKTIFNILNYFVILIKECLDLCN